MTDKILLEKVLNEKGDYYYNIEGEKIIQFGLNYESGGGPTPYVRSIIALSATKDKLKSFFRNEINDDILVSIVLDNR